MEGLLSTGHTPISHTLLEFIVFQGQKYWQPGFSIDFMYYNQRKKISFISATRYRALFSKLFKKNQTITYNVFYHYNLNLNYMG